jgi:hypothetical protein
MNITQIRNATVLLEIGERHGLDADYRLTPDYPFGVSSYRSFPPAARTIRSINWPSAIISAIFLPLTAANNYRLAIICP